MEEETCRCETDDGDHAEWCDLYPMEAMTKAEFVRLQTVAAELAIDAFLILRDEGFEDDTTKLMAVQDVDESASCWARIGSCYGGGCKHG